MQSIVISVFAMGTVLGSGAAIVQHAHQDHVSQPAIVQTGESETVARESAATDGVCQPVRFRVYFPKNSVQINDAGHTLISQALGNVADCDDVDILIGAPEPQLNSDSARFTASKRSAALLAELEQNGLNGDVFVAREHDVLNGPGAYLDPPDVKTPDYIVVAIQPSESQPMAASEAPGLKT